MTESSRSRSRYSATEIDEIGAEIKRFLTAMADMGVVLGKPLSQIESIRSEALPAIDVLCDMAKDSIARSESGKDNRGDQADQATGGSSPGDPRPESRNDKHGEVVNLPDGLHRETQSLVLLFAEALAEKLRAAEIKYGYSDYWKDDDWKEECQAKLMEHIAKGDPRDVANYCAFLWHHGWPTVAPSHVGARIICEKCGNPTDGTQACALHGERCIFAPSSSAPVGWREALRQIRTNLDAGGRSTSNHDFLHEHGGALLDKVEEALDALQSSTAPYGSHRTISEGYQDVFNAIAAAVKIEAGNAIGISVEKFLANIPTVARSATAPTHITALSPELREHLATRASSKLIEECAELARHVLESEGDANQAKVLRLAARVWDLLYGPIAAAESGRKE